jgi:hypothetical protein
VVDFVVINETAFLNAWMDVRGKDGTWLPVLRDVLRMRENLDLGWIPPGTYPSLWEDYSGGGGGGGGGVEFLNRVVEGKWSCVETTVDGETWESPDARPLESRPEDDGIGEEAPRTDDALLSEAPPTETGETAFGDTPRSWTQQMREGFSEILEGDGLPFASQFECTDLSQLLPSTPAYSLVSSETSEDSFPECIDMARDRDGHDSTLSQVPETDPAPTIVVPVVPTLSEVEIAALVATHLRRYSQAMVWDIPIVVTEHLAKPARTLGSLHPNAMSTREETSVPLETEFFLKTKDYTWKSVISLLNISAIMKDIR